MASCDESLEEQFFGTVTVGERGQVVIPAEARRRYNINTGDKLLVMAHPPSNGIILCGIEAMREFLGKFMEGLEKYKDTEATEISSEK
ncbi:MAG: AbrB/MazE/SpoVT family DNA-binding domain-containing protein [Armatimonadota bacterium]